MISGCCSSSYRVVKHTWVYTPSFCANVGRMRVPCRSKCDKLCFLLGHRLRVRGLDRWWFKKGISSVSRAPMKLPLSSGNAFLALLSPLLLKCAHHLWIQQAFGQAFRKGRPQGEAGCRVGLNVEDINESRELCKPLPREERKVDWIMRSQREKLIEQQQRYGYSFKMKR